MERQQLDSEGSGYRQMAGCLQHINKTFTTQNEIS